MTNLQEAVSNLIDMKSIFLTLHEDAVVAALPAHARAIVERAIDRDEDFTSDSPIMVAINSRGRALRREILDDDSEYAPGPLAEQAVQDTVDEVLKIIAAGQANVVPFLKA